MHKFFDRIEELKVLKKAADEKEELENLRTEKRVNERKKRLISIGYSEDEEGDFVKQGKEIYKEWLTGYCDTAFQNVIDNNEKAIEGEKEPKSCSGTEALEAVSPNCESLPEAETKEPEFEQIYEEIGQPVTVGELVKILSGFPALTKLGDETPVMVFKTTDEKGVQTIYFG